jgi:membrane protein
MDARADGHAVPRAFWRPVRDALWRILVATVGASFRNRVTGLAAEAAFFALLSLPPLIFGLAGAIGFVFRTFTDQQVSDFKAEVVDFAGRAFTEDTVSKIVAPTLDDVVGGPRVDVISIGFVLALWSGARALNVIVDTVTIMYGLGGERGIVRTRVLSFSLYLLALVVGVVAVPLVVAGPTLVHRALPARLDGLSQLYWPVVVVVCVCSLATLYHVSVPVRTSWRYNLPGAAFTLLVWVVGSYLLRWFLTVTAGESTSIYGPLAAPIAVLIWLYLLAMSLLIGAALNASVDQVFPEAEVARARSELTRRLRLRAVLRRRRGDDHGDDPGPAPGGDAEVSTDIEVPGKAREP